MKKIQVEIKGLSPLLMNSPKGMLEEKEKMKKTTMNYNHEVEAERVAYRDKKGQLFIPSAAIKGCLVNAAAYKKFGKHTARPIIAGGVFITPNEVLLGTKDYEIDVRTVVIQRARVVKARPVINEWKVSFILNYDETMIPDSESMIKPILEDAGKRVGLLDFRPQKLGNFGTFEVTKWKEE